jgi:uncharacterized membrane protein
MVRDALPFILSISVAVSSVLVMSAAVSAVLFVLVVTVFVLLAVVLLVGGTGRLKSITGMTALGEGRPFVPE